MKTIDWDDVGYETQPPADFVRGNVVEVRSLEEATSLLDEWIAAYDELRRDFVKLHSEYCTALFWAGVYKTGEESNRILYESALSADEELRSALLAQIKAAA